MSYRFRPRLVVVAVLLALLPANTVRAQLFSITATAGANAGNNIFNTDTESKSATIDASDYMDYSQFESGGYQSANGQGSGQLYSGAGLTIAVLNGNGGGSGQEAGSASGSGGAYMQDTATVESPTLPFGSTVQITLSINVSGGGSADASTEGTAGLSGPSSGSASGGGYASATVLGGGPSITINQGNPSTGANAPIGDQNPESGSLDLTYSGQQTLTTTVGSTVQFYASFSAGGGDGAGFQSSGSGSADGSMTVTFTNSPNMTLLFASSQVPAPAALPLFVGGLTCLGAYIRRRAGKS